MNRAYCRLLTLVSAVLGQAPTAAAAPAPWLPFPSIAAAFEAEAALQLSDPTGTGDLTAFQPSPRPPPGSALPSFLYCSALLACVTPEQPQYRQAAEEALLSLGNDVLARFDAATAQGTAAGGASGGSSSSSSEATLAAIGRALDKDTALACLYVAGILGVFPSSKGGKKAAAAAIA